MLFVVGWGEKARERGNFVGCAIFVNFVASKINFLPFDFKNII